MTFHEKKKEKYLEDLNIKDECILGGLKVEQE